MAIPTRRLEKNVSMNQQIITESETKKVQLQADASQLTADQTLLNAKLAELDTIIEIAENTIRTCNGLLNVNA
jgi:hypothetical protein